jgi:hypothetical protein
MSSSVWDSYFQRQLGDFNQNAGLQQQLVAAQADIFNEKTNIAVYDITKSIVSFPIHAACRVRVVVGQVS